ncbi:DNA translocase FtsK, partial [Candidatus Parcubacteria bacterium]
TESKKALNVFRWAIQEMERRYDVLLESGSQNITSYLAKKKGTLPYVVIVVDELADLMTSHGKEVEGGIVRLAQMARATGIHLILSTQRPSVEILTGLIKANIPARIALQVASQIDSRTILDMSGAEKLLGGGDLLYLSPKTSKPVRVQGSFISEKEVRRVVSFIKEHNADYFGNEESEEEDAAQEGQETLSGATREISFDALGREEGEEEDDLYSEAVRVVAQAKKASASLLQRRLRIGYARAARLLDIMEEHHIIGPGDGAKPREVFLENIPDHLLE